MSILDEIVTTKRAEVARLESWASALEAQAREAPEPGDLAAALAGGDRVSLIAEVKRRSPGAGTIREPLNAAGLAASYEQAGAAAVSILTDETYFGGSLEDVRGARQAVEIPILRKDFVLHESQIFEARAAGADAVLLIVRILEGDRLGELRETAESLGMTALVEVHDAEELDRALGAGARVVGVNNRDLSTFETRLEVTLDLVERVPDEVVLVSESGIATSDDVARLGAAGVDGILVGEALLRNPDPGEAAGELVGVQRVERSRA